MSISIINAIPDQGGASTSVSSFGFTLANAPINGNTLVACMTVRDDSIDGTGTTFSSIIQPGVTWTLVQRNNQENGNPDYVNLDVEIWVGVVGPGALPSITVNLSRAIGGSTPAAVIDVCEFKGLLKSNFVDQVGAADSMSASPTSNTGTTPITTQAVELWIGVTSIIPSSPTDTQTNPTNGFILVDGNHSGDSFLVNIAVFIKIVSLIGNANSTATISVADPYVGCIVTLKAAQLIQQTYGDGLTSYVC
jgi:hypothetical protein